MGRSENSSSDNVPFSPPAILRILASSLHREADSQPQLKNPVDGVALFTHACLLSVGFRLVGLGEDDSLEPPIDESNPRPLPTNWNEGNGSYSFRYAHSQSSLQFLIRVNRLGTKTVFLGLGIGDDKTTTFDIVTKDYMSANFFPYSLPSSSDVTTTLRNLVDGFISESRLKDLASLVKINLVQKLVPSLVKEGYEEELHRVGDTGAGSSRQREPPPNDPLRGTRPEDDDPLRVPRPYGDAPYGGIPRGPPPIPAGDFPPPGFDDEYQILNQPRGGYGQMPGGRNPLSIGADDLNPPGLGGNPPLRGPFFGEGGGIGPMGPMGGMHPTPDHPMFGGGAGFPNPRAPPGSRYDPVGPGDYPPQGAFHPPGRRSGGPGGPGGAPFNPFSQYGSGDFM